MCVGSGEIYEKFPSLTEVPKVEVVVVINFL